MAASVRPAAMRARLIVLCTVSISDCRAHISSSAASQSILLFRHRAADALAIFSAVAIENATCSISRRTGMVGSDMATSGGKFHG